MPLCRRDVIVILQGKHELSTAELERLGISRQYVSLLKRAGVLERVRHGRYRLSARYDCPASPQSRPIRISIDRENRSQ